MSDPSIRHAVATRRQLLGLGAGALSVLMIRPAGATPAAMEGAIRALAGSAEIRAGRVKLEVPPLVENGNSVALTVRVESPMTSDEFVRSIAIFNEKNPQPNVATFHLGPRAGRAVVSTRMRMADSQKIVAVAELADGTFWSDSADVIVTLAACLES
jgi:sulfur-oxidizing protein SoxY